MPVRHLAAVLRFALLASVLAWSQSRCDAGAGWQTTSFRADEAPLQPVARASSPVRLLAAPRGAGAAMHGAAPGPAKLAPALAPAVPARIVFACSAAVRAA